MPGGSIEATGKLPPVSPTSSGSRGDGGANGLGERPHHHHHHHHHGRNSDDVFIGKHEAEDNDWVADDWKEKEEKDGDTEGEGELDGRQKREV